MTEKIIVGLLVGLVIYYAVLYYLWFVVPYKDKKETVTSIVEPIKKENLDPTPDEYIKENNMSLPPIDGLVEIAGQQKLTDEQAVKLAEQLNNEDTKEKAPEKSLKETKVSEDNEEKTDSDKENKSLQEVVTKPPKEKQEASEKYDDEDLNLEELI